MAEKKFILVVYDISNDRRRTKLHDLLLDYGTPVQYSVFECEINDTRLIRLQRDLMQVIDAEEDNVRFYPLNEADIKKIITQGRATLDRIQKHYVV